MHYKEYQTLMRAERFSSVRVRVSHGRGNLIWTSHSHDMPCYHSHFNSPQASPFACSQAFQFWNAVAASRVARGAPVSYFNFSETFVALWLNFLWSASRVRASDKNGRRTKINFLLGFFLVKRREEERRGEERGEEKRREEKRSEEK